MKVDVRLPGKGNSNLNDARPVHLIITMIRWIRTSRLSMKNSLSKAGRDAVRGVFSAPHGPGRAGPGSVTPKVRVVHLGRSTYHAMSGRGD